MVLTGGLKLRPNGAAALPVLECDLDIEKDSPGCWLEDEDQRTVYYTSAAGAAVHCTRTVRGCTKT